MSQTSITPWWLHDSSVVCARCLQGYARAIEVRCVSCDGPSCPHCVIRVRETREFLCEYCAASSEPTQSQARAKPRGDSKTAPKNSQTAPKNSQTAPKKQARASALAKPAKRANARSKG